MVGNNYYQNILPCKLKRQKIHRKKKIDIVENNLYQNTLPHKQKRQKIHRQKIDRNRCFWEQSIRILFHTNRSDGRQIGRRYIDRGTYVDIDDGWKQLLSEYSSTQIEETEDRYKQKIHRQKIDRNR